MYTKSYDKSQYVFTILIVLFFSQKKADNTFFIMLDCTTNSNSMLDSTVSNSDAICLQFLFLICFLFTELFPLAVLLQGNSVTLEENGSKFYKCVYNSAVITSNSVLSRFLKLSE